MSQFKYDVFISYSRKDTDVADKITKAFEDAGISFFIDRQGVGGGVEFPAMLAQAIRESKVFLFLASKNSYESKFSQNEIVYAFNKKEKKDIIPYIIDGSSLPEELEFTFASINWRNIKEHPIETTLVDDVLLKVGKQRVDSGKDELNKKEQGLVSPRNIWSQYVKNPITGEGLAITILSITIAFLLFAFFVGKNFLQTHSGSIEQTVVLTIFVSFVLFFIGLVRPASVCLNNRKEVFKFYLSSLLISFIALVIFVIKESKDEDTLPKVNVSNHDDNICRAIDLGLPSGTLWGDRNLGAESSTDFGDLFAWGEIETKEDYSPYTYVEQLKPNGKLVGAKRDAATAALGDEWAMPSEKQYQELITECQWNWVMRDGHNGYEIIGKNGNKLFLPASGWSCDTSFQYRNQYGYYWTSERSSNIRYARSLQFPKNGKGIVGNGILHYGRSIRAIYVREAIGD